MLHIMNAENWIDPRSEMRYQFHQTIDTTFYPQVHDFYELSLVIKGKLNMTVDNWSQNIQRGTLLLLRPGDIHSRASTGESTYINIAFPSKLVTDMFIYLDKPNGENLITEAAGPLIVSLSAAETTLLQTRLERLNLIPVNKPDDVCAQLRLLMLEVMMQHILPLVERGGGMNCPVWLGALAKKLEDPENFFCTLGELSEMSGRTKEHLCRSFRKYFGVAPIEYINAKRLNYAANLLLHSDMKVVDIAFASGFQSLSRFYHAFREEFDVSPLDYRQSCTDSGI